LPASDLVVGDEICSSFVEPVGQRKGRSAVVAALGNGTFDPPQALVDLIRNLPTAA